MPGYSEEAKVLVKNLDKKQVFWLIFKLVRVLMLEIDLIGAPEAQWHGGAGHKGLPPSLQLANVPSHLRLW